MCGLERLEGVAAAGGLAGWAPGARYVGGPATHGAGESGGPAWETTLDRVALSLVRGTCRAMPPAVSGPAGSGGANGTQGRSASC